VEARLLKRNPDMKLWRAVLPLAAMSGMAMAQNTDVLFYNPANGHYYRAVVLESEADYPTWSQARLLAESSYLRGVPGYLATVTSKAENDFLIATVGPLRSPRGDMWIGGSDSEVDGEWRWVTGPETGMLFWKGLADGTALGFADWATNSPNDAFGPATESRLGWVEDGWNDLPDTSFRPGYIIEYSDVPPEDPGSSTQGPDIIELRADPERLYVGQDGYAIVVADASSEGRGASIAGIELSVNGSAWRALSAMDGRFDEVWETSLQPIGPFEDVDNISLCARARDSAGVLGPTACTGLPTIDIASFGDFQPPLLGELQLYRSRQLVGQDNQVTAFADDTQTGGSRIQGMQYFVRSRSFAQFSPVWVEMQPVDGTFDRTFKSGTAVLAPLGEPGPYEVCVRALDSAGNFSVPACQAVDVVAR
jgi:hypothetical protein